MKIHVTASPHMLLETVELLFAHINHTPPERLTATGAYCLPVPAVAEILEVACGDIPRDDPTMVYYFGSYTLPEDSRRETCIARHLAYNHMFLSSGTVAGDCAILRQAFSRHGLSRPIVYLEDFSARYEDPEQQTELSLLDSISRLGLAPDYTQKLLEQFSDYDQAISRLEALIAPVARKLEPLLAPWVQAADKLAQTWQESLSTADAMAGFLRRICFRNREQIDRLHIQLRYLRPDQGPGQVSNLDMPLICLHMGLAIPVGGQDPNQFLPWEFEAMRLLGNPVRLQILHTLWDTPMTTRELAKALNLNLGNLSRDISNLCEYRLLVLETVQDRKRYCTNREVLKILGDHLARFGTLQLTRPR